TPARRSSATRRSSSPPSCARRARSGPRLSATRISSLSKGQLCRGDRVLVELLEKDAVPFATLHARYGSLLELMRTLLGVVPNSLPYLEIWPAACRTLNVMVPNFLNLPFLLWGLGAPRSTVGLAMYVSSRAAGCAYCSAHSCSFALRRGASIE